MSLQTSKDVKQYLLLSQKPLTELQTIADGLGLSVEGTEAELVERLLAVPIVQVPKFSPHMFALTSTTKGKELLRSWRSRMYGTGKVENFTITSPSGKTEKIRRKSFRLSSAELQSVLQAEMIKERTFQTQLIESLKTDPTRYEASILLNSDKTGNSWLVLHIEAKAA